MLEDIGEAVDAFLGLLRLEVAAVDLRGLERQVLASLQGYTEVAEKDVERRVGTVKELSQSLEHFLRKLYAIRCPTVEVSEYS